MSLNWALTYLSKANLPYDRISLRNTNLTLIYALISFSVAKLALL